jgi:orotidine-5'-phosphate decarboxylase
MNPKDRIIVALDLPSADAALKMVDTLGDSATFYKIGLQLFCAEGPSIVRSVQQRGKKVFLDLKFNDIPNTVAGAVNSVAALGVDMLTIHAGGGRSMMAAALEAASHAQKHPLVLGVTVLTSMDEPTLHSVGVRSLPTQQVENLATLAHAAGLRGLVCSPEEVAAIRKLLPQIKLVVPGIRPAGSDKGDQTRVATPAKAVRDGADYLVIGRPITTAPDPRTAFARILEELS